MCVYTCTNTASALAARSFAAALILTCPLTLMHVSGKADRSSAVCDDTVDIVVP